MGWIFWVGAFIVLFIIGSQIFWHLYLKPRYNNVKGVMNMARNIQDLMKELQGPATNADPNEFMPIMPSLPEEKKGDKKKPTSPSDFKLKTDCDV